MPLTKTETGYTLSGDLTAQTARALYDQTPTFPPTITKIDLTQTGNTDSAGLALLLHWSHLATGNLIFTTAPTQLKEMAKISGVEDLFSE